MRTWRLRHSDLPRDPLEQYILDCVATDDRFLGTAPAIARFRLKGERWEIALQRFADAADVPVDVRWEALEQAGIRRDAPAGAWTAYDYSPDRLLKVLLGELTRSGRDKCSPGHESDIPIVRFRGRRIAISTQADFDTERVWRSHSVRELLDGYRAKPLAKNRARAGGFQTAASADERFLLFIAGAGTFSVPAYRSISQGRTRLHDGTLDVLATLEDQLAIHAHLEVIRRKWKLDGGPS